MAQICLVCGSNGPFGRDYIQNVFDENNTTCDRKLSETICEIVDKHLDAKSVHTTILCKDCLNMCINYDMYRTNIGLIKSKLSEQFYKALEQNNALRTIEIKKEIKPGKLVVPASKLQPLPADYQLNLGKIAAMASRTQAKTPKPLLNLKVTIGNSVLTQSLTTSTVKMVKPMELPKEVIGEWTAEALPTEMFNEEHALTMEYDDEGNNTEKQDIMIEDSNIKSEQIDGARYINAENYELLLEGQEDEQPHTIVLDSNSSILQMMSAGQKLVYENGQISLVLDENDDVNDDGQDSNEDEESQIELQVSGDEETANAIIAAAQEQGGAFIKVESGEMYRVKSVQSHPSDSVPGKNTNKTNKQTNKQINTAEELVSRNEDGNYTCLVCPHASDTTVQAFSSDATSMVQHMKSAHSAKVYICATCGIIMRNRSEYATHVVKHCNSSSSGRARSYDCAVCNKSYNSRTLLQEHMNLHSGKRPYQCHVCDKAFASKYTRQAHIKTHQSRPRPFKCGTCGKCFLSQQNLSQHEKTHLGIKSFVCSTCNKAFATQHSLEVHYLVHSGTKSHVCGVCDKGFARKAELRDHYRTHTGERPFACEVCGARFSQRSNLHSHLRATHLGDRRHACPDCPKRFKRRRLLQYHIKAAHTGERPLVCEVCNTTFVYPEHYKKHIRIHSGERPYVCEICGKSFSSRDNRNTHRFVHSDKKPYECLACGASFMRKRMLVQHMNVKGHLAESIVVNQPRVTTVAENGFTDKQADIIDGDHISEEEEDKQEENDAESGKLFTLSEDNTIPTPEGGAIITVSTDSIEHTQISNENGGILQFIQVKMPDGKDGWVALND